MELRAAGQGLLVSSEFVNGAFFSKKMIFPEVLLWWVAKQVISNSRTRKVKLVFSGTMS